MRYFLLFLSLLSTHFAFGQDTYFKSSIVTLKGDTIKGLISNIYDSKSIKFKKKKSDKPILYTPQQLRGYVLDGNVFETKAINVSYYTKKSVSIGEVEFRLAKDIERGRYVDTVFLYKLVYGTVSLFKMTNKDGFTYYFAQKGGVLRELPPQYCTTSVDSAAMVAMLNRAASGFVGTNGFATYIHINDDYLDTLSYLLNDKRFINLPSQAFKYNQKSLSNYVSQYNKKKGIANGGILKSKISRKIFTGINAGLVYLNYDKDIESADLASAYAFKLYGLYPLSGTNRNVFAKFGVNYFTYRNDYYKKSIPSASFGLRYSSISGVIRPYAEASLAVASLNRNNRPIDLGFPMLLEAGVNVPIKDYFLTIGATHTPVFVYQLNGYKLWAFNIGLMF